MVMLFGRVETVITRVSQGKNGSRFCCQRELVRDGTVKAEPFVNGSPATSEKWVQSQKRPPR